MGNTRKVVKNSSWMIFQQLFLNLISIVAVGYIARTLGQENYGKFLFSFSIVQLFIPLVNMGLSPLMTREIARNRDSAHVLLSKIIVLRLVLSVLAYFLLILFVNSFNYPSDTKLIVYLAGMTLIFSSINYSFSSVLNGFERIDSLAKAQLISGLASTVLSVLVLLAGYRLLGLTLVYCFGNLLWMLLVVNYVNKSIPWPNVHYDPIFCQEYVRKGLPFFFPGLVSMLGAKAGIILLSLFVDDKAVSTYGAANTLVEKLIIIPDGVCTALFPTLANAFYKSNEDGYVLHKTFYRYLFIVALPVAVGATILASPITLLVYGKQYIESAIVLQILMWWLFFVFLNSIYITTLNAVHCEKIVARITYASTCIYILLSLILVNSLQYLGISIAATVSAFSSYILLSRFTKKRVQGAVVSIADVSKVVLSVFIMGVSIFILSAYNVIGVVIVGVFVYSIMLLLLKVVTLQELQKLGTLFGIHRANR